MRWDAARILSNWIFFCLFIIFHVSTGYVRAGFSPLCGEKVGGEDFLCII